MTEKKQEDFIDEIAKWKQIPSPYRWLRRVKRSLTGKMILLFLGVIFPLNLLMVLTTSFVTSSYEQRISESYAYQLELYRHAAVNQFSTMEQYMREILSIDNLVILTKGSTSDSTIDMIKFDKALSGIYTRDTYPGMYYVWDKGKDIIGFSNMNHDYTNEIRRGLEELIRENVKYSSGRNRKEILILENGAFLLERYDYEFFSIGVLFDIEYILRAFYSNSETQVGALYLTDGNGNLLAELKNDVYALENLERNQSDWNEHRLLIVSQSLGFGDFQLVHRTSRSEYMKDLQLMIVVLYILCAVSFIAIPLLCLFVMRWVTTPVKKLCLAMEDVESGNLEYQIKGETGSYQMDYLYYSFNHMVDELHHMVKDSYIKEIEKLQTDSINIRLQVNQHMLLNFLNTIYSLSCAGKSEQVNEFTLLLMNYFQYVLRQDIALVTIQEEMQFVQEYLKLQKIRFPNSFYCVYSVEEGAEKILIPQLLIENFVENAIKYGLILGKEIEILINVRTEDDKLILSVCDTGNGMSTERAQRLERGEIVEDQNGKHIGIWNCKRRLKYYYGDKHKLTISSSPNQGTQIWIEMMKEPLQKEDAAFKIRQMDNMTTS